MQQHIFLAHPVGPWGGVKRSNIIKFRLQSQFQRFLYQTLCMFSQIKDINNIEKDFHSVPGSCPRGETWVAGGGGSKI